MIIYFVLTLSIVSYFLPKFPHKEVNPLFKLFINMWSVNQALFSLRLSCTYRDGLGLPIGVKYFVNDLNVELSRKNWLLVWEIKVLKWWNN